MRQCNKHFTARVQELVAGIFLLSSCVSIVSAQDRAPLPPPMPHMGTVERRVPPTFSISADDRSEPVDSLSAPPVTQRSDRALDQLLPAAPQSGPETEPASAPMFTERSTLGAFGEYMQRQQAWEIERLAVLRTKIEELADVIREYKRSELAARESAERAKKREIAALATARETAKREADIAEKERELFELVSELERREQRLRSQQLTFEKQIQRYAPNPIGPDDHQPAVEEHTNPEMLTPVSEQPGPSPVTDGAVDKRGLADNLFGAGEYKLAADVYQGLIGDSKDRKESAWFRFQAGNCFRHLGNQELAAAYYREVAADTSDKFLADTARWWLNGIQQRSSTRSRVAELETILEQASKAIDTTLN